MIARLVAEGHEVNLVDLWDETSGAEAWEIPVRISEVSCTSPERWRKLAEGTRARMQPHGELAEFLQLVARPKPLEQKLADAKLMTQMLPFIGSGLRQLWRFIRQSKE